MNYRALGSVAVAAAIAFAQPVVYIAQEANKAVQIIAAARKAIGDKKLDALKTFSVQGSLQRNVNTSQVTSDIEIVLELPDKYLRSETPSGSSGMMMGPSLGATGFDGDRPLQKIQNGNMLPGGGMVIRIGGMGSSGGGGEKMTPEQIEEMSKSVVRNSRVEASRLMLGWFASAHPAANATYFYAGEAESAEGKAHVIDVKNAENLAVRLFIDEVTNLPLMVTYKAPQPRMITNMMTSEATSPADLEKQMQELQKQAPVLADYAMYFEDWRDVDGIKFPFRMRRSMAGTTTEEWTVNKVKVNPKVDPKRFAGES